MRLKVYYGYAYLNNTIKHKALRVLFENERHNPVKNDAFARKALKIVHERYQTDGEAKDAQGCHRTYTCYEKFIDKAPFKGDIDKVLQFNFEADSNNVSLEEREEIRQKMRKAYFQHYGIKEANDKNKQLKLEL
ncbi:hypothetical protein JZU61_04300 [bacterium]|jgi:hypothetical protein|nr:hypothetical protein [bacterium]